MMEVLPNYLFGPYVIEISRYFTQLFQNKVKIDNTATPKSLIVSYGVPKAAFRFVQETYNGKIVLPLLNFWIADNQRIKSKERVNVFLYSYDDYNPVDNTISFTRNPAHFDVTFNFNLWTNNLRERDFIIHEIIQKFPMGELSLIYFIDKTTSGLNETQIKRKKEYLLMPLSFDGSFRDETGIDSIEMPETRDVIKTAFDIKTETIVPHNVYRMPIITKINILGKMVDIDHLYNQYEIIDDFVNENIVGQ